MTTHYRQNKAADEAAAKRREELARLEPAARELCIMRGADPDAIVRFQEAQYGYEGPTFDVLYRHPLWERAAHEIERHMQVQSVLEFVK